MQAEANEKLPKLLVVAEEKAQTAYDKTGLKHRSPCLL